MCFCLILSFLLTVLHGSLLIKDLNASLQSPITYIRCSVFCRSIFSKESTMKHPSVAIHSGITGLCYV